MITRVIGMVVWVGLFVGLLKFLGVNPDIGWGKVFGAGFILALMNITDYVLDDIIMSFFISPEKDNGR